MSLWQTGIPTLSRKERGTRVGQPLLCVRQIYDPVVIFPISHMLAPLLGLLLWFPAWVRYGTEVIWG